jgi:hypothetical protein
MRVTTGRVVDGKFVIADESFAEGLTVTVPAPEDGETFTLGPDAEIALLEAMGEGDRGEVIAAEDLPRELGRTD